MAKFDIKTAKPLIKTINHQVMDPVRYPKVIVPYEKKMRDSFSKMSNRLLVDLTKKMVDLKK